MKLIASLLVFYPLILPIWQQKPLTHKLTSLPEKRKFIDKNEVNWQIEHLRKIKDPRIKSRMVFDLSKSNNPETVKGLLSLLKDSSEMVKTDILLTLYNMRNVTRTGQNPLFLELIKDKNERIVTYSSALYLNNGGNPNEILGITGEESSAFMLNFLESELIEKAEVCDIALLAEKIESKNSRLSSIGVSLLSKGKSDPDKSSVLATLPDSEDVTIRATLSKALSERDSGGINLLTKLSRDKSATVRGYVASSRPSKNRLPLLLQLCADSDDEVRRTAAVSLGNFNHPDAIGILIGLFSDSAPEVRKAAEDSIIKINPNKDFLNIIGDKSLQSEPSRASAIRVLGELKHKPYSKQINDYLGSLNDDEIIFRTILALDYLDYKQAVENIKAKASHSQTRIRRAVAHALGTLALKESFDTIISLSNDPQNAVVQEAIISMGRTESPYFNKHLNKLIHLLSNRSSDIRSSAAWSIARINKPMKESLKQLNNLALNRVIPVIGGIPSYDADHSRISATLALIDIGKTEPETKKAAEQLIEILLSDKVDKYGVSISGTKLKEFARQAKLYSVGTTNIPPTPLSTERVQLSVKKIRK